MVEQIETMKFYGKIKSTKLPRLELIPKSALECYAERLELGIERKGDGAYNALNTKLIDEMTVEQLKDFTIERLAHIVHHAYDAIGKIVNCKLFEGEDDAGAILFGGGVLAEYRKRIKK